MEENSSYTIPLCLAGKNLHVLRKRGRVDLAGMSKGTTTMPLFPHNFCVCASFEYEPNG
jgi:hypothetical protein